MRIATIGLLLLLLMLAGGPATAAIVETIEQTQPKMVKIYGAGGVRGLEAYQSGMFVSPTGHILTAYSYVLDTDEIEVVTSDGRRFTAKLLGADPRLEVAVLKIEAQGLPYFDLAKAVRAAPGSRALAMSNLFGVAVGDEAVSAQRAIISTVAKLDARRGTFETPYHGPVYVLDATVNNPGAAGGALIDAHGALLGMLGKELRNSANNTWLNYSLPIDEIRPSVEAILAGKFVAKGAETAAKKPAHPHDLTSLGIVLVPDVLERTPPYIDFVRPGSPADKAGLRPDDLIVLVGDRLVQSCKILRDNLEYLDRADEITLTVLRGQEMRTFPLRAEDGFATKENRP